MLKKFHFQPFSLKIKHFLNTGQTLDIKTDLLRRWKREYEKLQECSFYGHGNANLSDLEKENLRLKKELREAQLEKDILKKAAAVVR